MRERAWVCMIHLAHFANACRESRICSSKHTPRGRCLSILRVGNRESGVVAEGLRAFFFLLYAGDAGEQILAWHD